MREVMYYVADDGTQFEDEGECREYEFAENARNCHYVLMNSSHRILNNAEPESYENCSFIFIPNVDAGNDLRNNWDEDIIGDYIPDVLNEYNPNPGLYAYDYDCEEWFHVGERISELQDMADEVMAVINGA